MKINPCCYFNVSHLFLQIHILNKTVHCNSLGQAPSHPSWLLTLNTVNHLMLISNSSANFIIYCFMGKRWHNLRLDNSTLKYANTVCLNNVIRFRQSLLSTLSDCCRIRTHVQSPEQNSQSNTNQTTETSFIRNTNSYRMRKVWIS